MDLQQSRNMTGNELFRESVLCHPSEMSNIRGELDEAELIKQEAAIKASRTMLLVKQELEAAENGLDALRKVLEFSDSNCSEPDCENKPTCTCIVSTLKSFLTHRYVEGNVRINNPLPNPNLELPTNKDENEKTFRLLVC